MAGNEFKLTAEKVKRREQRLRLLKIILLIIVVLLTLLYIVLALIYEVGNFTVTLDPSANVRGALVIYENKKQRLCLEKLKADELDYMTNIAGEWIPRNIQDGPDGSKNGQNYIAYTFYAENQGEEVINYWATIEITDVIKNADEAIRVKVIRDDEITTYAKLNKSTGEEEKGTKSFWDKGVVMLEQLKDFKPGEIHKYTVVIWIEGNDPECVDDIIGGEVKMRMRLTEEHIEQKQ